MTTTNKTVVLSINEIVVIDDFNIRANQLNQAKIADYADIFDKLPNISVFDVDGKTYLVDGWHRLEAAKRLSKPGIHCQIVGQGTLVEAQDYADQANLNHGIMLTAEQRRQIAKRFLDRHSEWTAREVAKVMGVNHSTVVRWMNETDDSGANAPNDPERTETNQSASQDGRAAMIDIRIVSSALKRWWNKEGKVKPFRERSEAWRAQVKKELQPAVDIYNQL
jgi:hypothetical protein